MSKTISVDSSVAGLSRLLKKVPRRQLRPRFGVGVSSIFGGVAPAFARFWAEPCRHPFPLPAH